MCQSQTVWWRGHTVVGKTNEEVMERVCTSTMMRKASWKKCKGPASPVWLHLEDSDFLSGQDTTLQCQQTTEDMILKGACFDDVKQNDDHVVKRVVLESLGREVWM